MKVSLLGPGALAALTLPLTLHLPVTSAETTSCPYTFNPVAVSGGGYITGIIGHPWESDLLYVRTDIGGSYRWDAQSQKWIPLNDFITATDENLLGTESIALDPHDPDALYLAQGRYLASENSAFFVSRDRGENFEVYPAPFRMGANELGRNNGERLAVNPFRAGELWMGTRGDGLVRSTDGAKSWGNVTSFPNRGEDGLGIYFVLFDHKNEGTVYVGVGAPGGIYVTEDSGETWDAVPGQPLEWDDGVLVFPDEAQPQSSGPVPMKGVLAENGALYVTYADAPGPYGATYGGVYVYNTTSDSGDWVNITPGAGNTEPVPFTNQTFPAGGFCGISVDLKDPETLVVVSLDRDPGPALDSIYLSHDGGRSWRDVSQLSTPEGSGGYWGHPIEDAAFKDGTAIPWLSFNWGPQWGGYGAPSPIRGLTKFGWWMTAVLIDPSDSDHLLYGTGATIWATDSLSNVDKSQSPDWYIQAQGIEESVALAMASPNGGSSHLLTGLGDINGYRYDDLDVPQPMFDLPVFSNLNALDWAGQKPGSIIRAGPCGHNYTDGCGLAAYSADGGSSWTKFATCIPGIEIGTPNPGVIAIDASGKHIVWSSAMTTYWSTLQAITPRTNESGPYATNDLGQSWISPTGLNVQTPNISADRVQPRTFYSFTDGKWYLSRDGGLSYRGFDAKDIGLPTYPGAIPIANFNRAGEIWIALGDLGVYHTRNFGRKWVKITGQGVAARHLTIGAGAHSFSGPALFIVGRTADDGPLSQDGVYRSDDNGKTWVQVTDAKHQYGGVGMIQGDPRVYGRVYLGTGGRGIIYADIDQGKRQD
ncbi:WD40/YVTN/BNR-like repeat-containing protein [Aspergillus undulatus]|uniref:WD40/YVTN/BNR-like repeat-containing protein n=1 Tax=Aspergillus undulatus TaxID=1810928 RepID=UPI003CCCC942